MNRYWLLGCVLGLVIPQASAADAPVFRVENRMPPTFAVATKCQPPECTACGCAGSPPARDEQVLPPHPSPPGFHWERESGRPWTLVEGTVLAGARQVGVQTEAIRQPHAFDPDTDLVWDESQGRAVLGREWLDGGGRAAPGVGTAPGVAAPQPFRNVQPSGTVRHAGHNCPSCGTAEYRVAGFNRDGTHVHSCSRCGTRWSH